MQSTNGDRNKLKNNPLPRWCVSTLERITRQLGPQFTQVADDEREGHMKGRHQHIARHKMVAPGDLSA